MVSRQVLEKKKIGLIHENEDGDYPSCNLFSHPRMGIFHIFASFSDESRDCALISCQITIDQVPFLFMQAEGRQPKGSLSIDPLHHTRCEKPL